jgi:O-antigen ligase
MQSVNAYADGSPIDRATFLFLILWGLVVLFRRAIYWRTLLIKNWPIVLYLAFCLLSILWTDQPFILLRRWLSYLFLPLSVLFIRYVPELGRGYRNDGSPMYTGVGNQKNDLGADCLITGIFLFWHWSRSGTKDSPYARHVTDLVLIGLIAWLLRLSDSQTSLACLTVVLALLMASRIRAIERRPWQIVSIAAVTTILFFALDSAFGLKDTAFEMLGRDKSLTNRTAVWEVVRSYQTNALVGAGFMSFWSGERMGRIWDEIGAGLIQAHNGYLEQYLNLGYIGVSLIVLMMVVSIIRVRRMFRVNADLALFRLCLLVTAALYNYTEASFYGINNIWLLTLVACIEIEPAREAATSAVDRRGESSVTGFAAERAIPAQAGAARVQTGRRFIPRSSA